VEPQAWHHFDRALEEVHREVGKVIFSLLANFAAERASEQGSAERALALAKAALVAATAVSQHSLWWLERPWRDWRWPEETPVRSAKQSP